LDDHDRPIDALEQPPRDGTESVVRARRVAAPGADHDLLGTTCGRRIEDGIGDGVGVGRVTVARLRLDRRAGRGEANAGGVRASRRSRSSPTVRATMRSTARVSR
jgi:hypothetical protein